MNNIHVSPDVLSTLMSLQQDNLYKLQQQNLHGISRSSRLEMFCKKASLKTYAKCTGDTCVWVFFKIKLRSEGASSFTKKRLKYSCFPVHFRNTYLKNICERLLLHLKYTLIFISNVFFHLRLSVAKLFHVFLASNVP